MDYNLFDCVNNVYHKRHRYPTDQELSGKMWMINRFLSMEVDLLEPIAYVSKYFFTLGTRYYRLLYRLVPMTSSPRNKYLKPKEEFNRTLVEKYSDYFELNSREVVDYLKLLKSRFSEKEIFEFVGLEKLKDNGKEKANGSNS